MLRRQGVRAMDVIGADFDRTSHGGDARGGPDSPGQSVGELQKGYAARSSSGGDGEGGQSVSKRDYYESSRSPRPRRHRDQSCIDGSR
jgi:hypothetical protein